MGLQEYLTFCVGALERLLDFPLVHVVLGNEACDLDSAVSAIAYAYYLHETSTAPVGTAFFLPLMNVPRADFPLRTEVTHFLGKFGLTPAHLIFMDDLDLAAVKAKTDLKVTLVDHHVLSGALKDLEENVVQVLDHRPQDGHLPDRCDSKLELVGSCATLVSEVLLADDTFTMDAVTASLLHGAIITDTINFSPAAGKTTPKDVEITGCLEEVMGGGVDREAIFQDIKQAKFDLSGLTSKEILLKDLKLVSGDSLMVAMSSVTMEMNTLMERPDFVESLRSFAAEKKVDAVVVMTVSVGAGDGVARQLGIFSPSRVYRQQMADVLSACQSPNLGLSPLPCSCEEFLPFAQSNVTASRKQVLPVIKSFLAGETTPDEAQLDAYSDMSKDRSEGFTSMSSILGSRQNTFDGEITSEDLTSRDNSTEAELSPDEKLLLGGGKVFDPLSSVHSSDSASATSPTDLNRSAQAHNAERQLPVSGEIHFDLLGSPSPTGQQGEGSDPGEVAGDAGCGEGSTTMTTTDLSSPFLEEAVATRGGSQELSAAHWGAGDGSREDPRSPGHESVSFSHGEPSQEPVSVFNSSSSTAASACVENSGKDTSRHNGLQEEEAEDALEQDFLNMASPHDLLFPPDSPKDVSAATSGQTSGQTSGHGSKAPSYPVTPPNSYMDGGGLVTKEVHLPSFNSSEMVEKIQEKKAALGLVSGSEEASDALSPFTPQNSYVDTDFPAACARETQLPSFHSSDMVERIREKRSSMERDLLGGEGGGGEEAGAECSDSQLLEAGVQSPFTPHNSYVEGSLERYASETLPSLNNAEIAARIKQRQAELRAAAEGGEGSGGALSPPRGLASPPALTLSPAAPYTPQNSYREGHLESLGFDAHLADLNEVAERLSLTGSESSGSLSEPKAIRASNRMHLQGDTPQEAKGFFISEAEEEMSLGPEGRGGDFEGSEVKRKSVLFSQLQDNEAEAAAAAVMEKAIQKIAYELANEMIQKALETFPSASVKDLVPTEREGAVGRFVSHPSISEDSSPTMDESGQESSNPLSPASPLSSEKPELSPERDLIGSALTSSSESERLAAELSRPVEASMKTSSSLADELAQALDRSRADADADKPPAQRPSLLEGAAPKSESYEIETEYLSDMDPMHCVLSPDTNIIQTDAGKEVVEGVSFRKISGQEYQTVQEDIMEQIRQEAREREMAKRQHSSVAEEEDDDVSSDAGEAVSSGSANLPSDARKTIAPEAGLNLDDSLTGSDGKKMIHVVRDRELYASALENVSTEEFPVERTLQPSNSSHPLLDSSRDDSRTAEDPEELSAKKKIHASDFEDSSLTEEHHQYESFAETGSLGLAEERRRSESVQGDGSTGTPGVARTMSMASDVSVTGSQRGAGLKGAEFQDEWQDDELPSMIGAEDQALAEGPMATAAASDASRKRLVPDQGLVGAGDSLENVEVVDSDSEIDSDMDNEQLEWETRKLLGRDDTPVQTPTKPVVEVEEIPQYTAAEERGDARNWKMINIGEGQDFRLDMRVIEPYKRVLSHGGYYGDELNAMVVFSACYLPSRDRKDYSYVMNHLFHYVIHTLDELVADDYMIVYFHGATPRRQMPSFTWLKRCYQGIDRRLKKNLKALYLVHPTLWLKTVVLMTRPFISAKFSSKLQFVRTLDDLRRLIPMEYVYVPEIVQRYDDRHFHPSASSTPTLPSPQ